MQGSQGPQDLEKRPHRVRGKWRSPRSVRLLVSAVSETIKADCRLSLVLMADCRVTIATGDSRVLYSLYSNIQAL